jgi:TPR repeat protein
MPAEDQQRACARGDAKICAILGDAYERGKTGHYDYAKAIEFYEKACALNDYAACVGAARVNVFFKPGIRAWTFAQKACDANVAGGCAYLVSMYINKERSVAKARALAEKSCDENDAFGCYWLGNSHQPEEDENSDPKTAIRAFAKAKELSQRECDKNYMFFCDILGRLYHSGVGVGKDIQKAILFYEQSCEAKIRLACHNLSEIYGFSDDIAKDQEKAARYEEKACGSGGLLDCFSIGLKYSLGGDGVQENAVKAASMWQKGCELDDDSSCESLGSLYMAGAKGIEQDIARGTEFYKKAFTLQKNGCEIDREASACSALGSTYNDEKGKIVPYDPEKSAAAYEMARSQWRQECDRGDPLGCFAVGRVYENGKGVEESVAAVLKYYDNVCPRYYPGCRLEDQHSDADESANSEE